MSGVNNNIWCLPLQTGEESGICSHMKVCSLSGRVLKKGRGRGPDCVPDVVSLSACLITALPRTFPFPLLQQELPPYAQAGAKTHRTKQQMQERKTDRKKEKIETTIKVSCHFHLRIFINH